MQDQCGMKVTTDACLFGAWAANVSKTPQYILDIGGGTGLLSLMLAQKHAATIDCIEIDKNAFEQTCLNIKASPWQENVRPHHTDIGQYSTCKKYDLIISNPPFHEHHLISDDLSINLARHSDKLDLLQLFKSADQLSNDDAQLFILLPHYRKNECLQLAQKKGWYLHQVAEVRQTSHHEYFRIMVCMGKNKSEIRQHEIIIKNETGEYTSVFKQLLKEYYLFL